MRKAKIPEEEDKELASEKITCIYCGQHRKKCQFCHVLYQALPAKMAGGVEIQSSW